MDVSSLGIVTEPSLHGNSLGDSQLLITSSDAIDDSDTKAPKKRSETWTPEEIRALISLRGEMEKYFGTSKSNRHVWEQISSRMKGFGFDRNATMCTDKWRNLLKDHKKAKAQNKLGGTKLPIYKELEMILIARKAAGKSANGGIHRERGERLRKGSNL